MNIAIPVFRVPLFRIPRSPAGLALTGAAASVVAGLWGSASWYDRFPAGAAAGMVEAVFLFCLSAFVSLSRPVDGRPGPAAAFVLAFLPVAVFSALTLGGSLFPQEGPFLVACLVWDGLVRACLHRRSRRRPAAVPPVSTREGEIAALVAAGLTNAEIARTCCISLPTVKTHLAHLFEKTGSRNRVELARWHAGRTGAAAPAAGFSRPD